MKKFLLRIVPTSFIIAAVGAAVFWMQHTPDSEKEFVGEAPSGVSIDAGVGVGASPAAGYIEYLNHKYNFSFYHEAQGEVQEYDEGGGASTVVYENEQAVRGFQIYILPYAEKSISEERFKTDVPSRVRKEVQPATLDGVEAVTFTSYDETLGDTTEIWVIHKGYLYEITTFKGVGDWFNPIIQSWHFLP